MRRWFVGFLLCFLGIAWAQQELMEIIPLRAKTPDEVIPVLSPLLEPGATLTGANNQLILRASKRNRDDIKRALAAIDVPARNLIIHVSLSRDADTLHQGGVATGKVVVGTKSRVEGNARVWDTRSQSQESGSQMIRAIEGGRAFIQVGRSLPIPLRQVTYGPQGPIVTDAIEYHDIGNGFYVEPRLTGDRVILEISQQSASMPHRLRSGLPAAQVQRLTTTVSGRLGEWIQLGGTGQQSGSDQRGTLNLSTRELRESRAIWLKVEEVR